MPGENKPDGQKKDDNQNHLDLANNPQFKQLASVVSQLGKGQQQLQQSLGSLNDSIGKLTSAVAPQKKEEPPTSDDDINNMSQAELVQHVFGGVRKLFSGLESKVSQSLDELSSKTDQGFMKTELEKFEAEHKDLGEWVPEIKGLMQEKSGLTVAEAYTLARANNEQKTKEMDEKYKPKEDKPVERRQSFGGLTPTSGGFDVETDDVKADKGELDRQSAAEKAWEETFGDNPALAGSDEDMD